MNLESSLKKLLATVLSSQSHRAITAKQLIHCIDLTLLDEQASDESLGQLNVNASHHQVAAICVYSRHLAPFQGLNAIQRATVINFPHGDEKLAASLASIENAVLLGATEIDYVFPYRIYLDGKKQDALNQCHAVIELCKAYNLTSKIILETGAFQELEHVYEVCTSLIALDCNFLKTSTGKILQGASLPAVFTILSAIKDANKSCGLKISGGIKTSDTALKYAILAELMMSKEIDKSWFRIGASGLLNDLLKSQSYKL